MSSLTEKDWRRLLANIRDKRVVPVLGPGVVTIDVGGDDVPLMQAAVPALAQMLELPELASCLDIKSVVRAYLSANRLTQT